MKKNIILMAFLLLTAGMVGCSSSSSSDSSDGSGGSGGGGTLVAGDLTGTWSGCQNDGEGGYLGVTVTITSSNIDLAITAYQGANCTGTINDSGSETLSYTLSGSCTLDGAVAGITSGTALDTTVITSDFNPQGETTYDCIAVSGNNLYVGDDTADPARDASAPDKRPETLDDTPFVKQ